MKNRLCNDLQLFDDKTTPSGWSNPLRQLILIIKWHIGFLCGEALGYSPKSLTKLKPSRVLIVGTGPSLSRLDASLASNYDCLVAINHALHHQIFSQQSKTQQLIWFSHDPVRLLELSSDLYHASHLKCLFYPVIPSNILRLLAHPKLRCCISFVKPKTYFSRYKDMIMHGKAHTSVHPSLSVYLDSCDQVLACASSRIPCSHMTSALTAVVLFASLGAKQIDLIGCDLNSSRDPLFGELGDADFNNDIGRRLVYDLELVMARHDINLHNLSWD
jgi:hypothetical protein